MDKYTLLILLNLPFVVFGFVKSFAMYKKGLVQRIGLMLRLFFWSIILFGLLFARNVYEFLFSRNLTDTTPLSIADVILVTGVIFSLFLCMRLYAKNELLEQRVTELHEKLSILNSKKN